MGCTHWERLQRHLLGTPVPGEVPTGQGLAHRDCHMHVASMFPVMQDFPSMQAEQTPRPKGPCAGQTWVPVPLMSLLPSCQMRANCCTFLSLILYNIKQNQCDQTQTRVVEDKMCVFDEWELQGRCECPGDGRSGPRLLRVHVHRTLRPLTFTGSQEPEGWQVNSPDAGEPGLKA